MTELTISGQFLIAVGWQVPMTASSQPSGTGSAREIAGPGPITVLQRVQIRGHVGVEDPGHCCWAFLGCPVIVLAADARAGGRDELTRVGWADEPPGDIGRRCRRPIAGRTRMRGIQRGELGAVNGIVVPNRKQNDDPDWPRPDKVATGTSTAGVRTPPLTFPLASRTNAGAEAVVTCSRAAWAGATPVATQRFSPYWAASTT